MLVGELLRYVFLWGFFCLLSVYLIGKRVLFRGIQICLTVGVGFYFEKSVQLYFESFLNVCSLFCYFLGSTAAGILSYSRVWEIIQR